MFADGMCDKCMHEKAVYHPVPFAEGEEAYLDLCLTCHNAIVRKREQKKRQEEEERRRAISKLPLPRQCLYLGWYKTCKEEICAMNMKVMARKCGFLKDNEKI